MRTATKALRTSTRKVEATSIGSYAVIIFIISNLILSVDAIRCHQCNSHTHEDCSHLLVNTPRAQRDNQYLVECKGDNADIAFCRKTVISFDVNDEKRIERSCGWIQETHHNTCFTADNEGYKQVICTCTDEGCNGAPTHLNRWHYITILGTVTLSILLAQFFQK